MSVDTWRSDLKSEGIRSRIPSFSRDFRESARRPRVIHVLYFRSVKDGRGATPSKLAGVLARGCLNARALFLSLFPLFFFATDRKTVKCFLPISQGVTTQTTRRRRSQARTEARTCARIDYERRYSNLPRARIPAFDECFYSL